MTFRVKRVAMALYETPDGVLPSERGGLIRGDLLDKMGDSDLPGWIEVVVVVGSDPQRIGFVPLDALEPVLAPTETIDADWFFNTLSLAARIFGSNHLYLYALAFAVSRIRNVQGPAGFGPFQYAPGQWSDAVAQAGTAAGVTLADRTDPYSQAVLAAAVAAEAAKSLAIELGRPATAADLFCLHLLGDALAIPALKAGTAALPGASQIADRLKLLPAMPAGEAPGTAAQLLDVIDAILQPGIKEAVVASLRLDPPGIRADQASGPDAADPASIGPTPGKAGVEQWRTMARDYGQRFGVPENYTLAMILTESGGNPEKIGDHGNSVGLFQMNITGEGHGMTVAERQNPKVQFDHMMPLFKTAFDLGRARGLDGPSLAVFIASKAEKPAAANLPHYGVSYTIVSQA